VQTSRKLARFSALFTPSLHTFLQGEMRGCKYGREAHKAKIAGGIVRGYADVLSPDFASENPAAKT